LCSRACGAFGTNAAGVVGKARRGKRITALDVFSVVTSAVPAILSALDRVEEGGRRTGGWQVAGSARRPTKRPRYQ